MKNLLFLFLTLFFVPCIASAEIVKCIDHGQVTYRNNSCAKSSQDSQEPLAAPNVREPVINRVPAVQAKPTEPEIVNNIAAPAALSVLLRNGSYTVRGSVKGVPAMFQIDTGASKTAVSKRIADAAGITDSDCVSRLDAATANGVVSVCLVSIPEITFGDFRIHDVDVIVMPDMQPEALLGMDILQHYVIEQRAKALRISN